MLRPMRVWGLSLLCSAWLMACEAPAAAKAKPEPAPKPQLVQGQVPVAPFVSELEAAHPGKVLVYVGATWCEPCRYFHQALEAGQLNALLGGMQVVEYDLDQHKSELLAAGYSARMIPLFALPKPDGTASPHLLSGSIKGPGAVTENLVPRLRELLGGARAH